MYEIE